MIPPELFWRNLTLHVRTCRMNREKALRTGAFFHLAESGVEAISCVNDSASASIAFYDDH